MTDKWNISLRFNNKKCPYIGAWFDLRICINPMSTISPEKIVFGQEEKFILCNIYNCPAIVTED